MVYLSLPGLPNPSSELCYLWLSFVFNCFSLEKKLFNFNLFFQIPNACTTKIYQFMKYSYVRESTWYNIKIKYTGFQIYKNCLKKLKSSVRAILSFKVFPFDVIYTLPFIVAKSDTNKVVVSPFKSNWFVNHAHKFYDWMRKANLYLWQKLFCFDREIKLEIEVCQRTEI